ncbi:hypothetical protein [Kordiimonas sp.]|uniref:hypothetical protein n=1 Tax=Kordiimonas sp. TaxID=1970157 RepID=UPI003A92032B
MKLFKRIHSALVAFMVAAMMVVVPSVFAAADHDCCVEEMASDTLTQMTDVQAETTIVAIKHASMIHKNGHVGQDGSACDVSCCGLAVTVVLIDRSPRAAGAWMLHVLPAPMPDQPMFSAVGDHITPPPRTI